MRRIVVVISAFLMFGATGCWLQDGLDAAHTAFDRGASLPAARVPSLTRAWVVDVGATSSSPLAFGGAIYESGGGGAMSFDASTGTQRWRTPLTSFDGSPANIGQLTAYGGTVAAPVNELGTGGVIAFDDLTGASSGSLNFHVSMPQSITSSPTLIASLIANYGSGGPVGLWLRYGGYEALIDIQNRQLQPATAPVIIGNHVLVGYGRQLQSYSITSCPPQPVLTNECLPEWTTTLPDLPQTPVGLDTNHVAVALANGSLGVFNVADGSDAWTLLSGTPTALTSPAVTPSELFAGGANGTVYAFPTACRTTSCGPTWSVSTGTAAISHQPAATPDAVYVGTSDGRVAALATAGCGGSTCPVIWHGVVDDSAIPGAILGPVIDGESIYAASTKGKLAAFRD